MRASWGAVQQAVYCHSCALSFIILSMVFPIYNYIFIYCTPLWPVRLIDSTGCYILSTSREGCIICLMEPITDKRQEHKLWFCWQVEGRGTERSGVQDIVKTCKPTTKKSDLTMTIMSRLAHTSYTLSCTHHCSNYS